MKIWKKISKDLTWHKHYHTLMIILLYLWVFSDWYVKDQSTCFTSASRYLAGYFRIFWGMVWEPRRTHQVNYSRRSCMLHCRLQLRVWLDSSSLHVRRSHQVQSPPPPPHDSHLTWGRRGMKSVILADMRGRIRSVRFLVKTHAVSDTISPWTPVNPSVPAATAAAAMVLTLFGASGHNSATEPLNKTRLPSSSAQSERTSPVSRKQDGCLDILINKAWKKRSRG